MKGRKLLGWLLVAGGVPFLLLGIGMTMFGLYGLGPVEHAVVALNGLTGASLVTAGVRHLGAPTRGRLAAVWGVSFLLAYAPALFGFVLRFVLLRMGGLNRVSSLGVIGSLLATALIAAVILLVVLSVRQRRRPRPHPMSRVPTATATAVSWLATATGYVGLAALGTVAWFVVALMTGSALGVPSEALSALGMMSLATAPVGLVSGILAGLWANAAQAGQRRLRRYGVAGLLLLVLPALGTAVLLLIQARQ